jgi:hypothetical protein
MEAVMQAATPRPSFLYDEAKRDYATGEVQGTDGNE